MAQAISIKSTIQAKVAKICIGGHSDSVRLWKWSGEVRSHMASSNGGRPPESLKPRHAVYRSWCIQHFDFRTICLRHSGRSPSAESQIPSTGNLRCSDRPDDIRSDSETVNAGIAAQCAPRLHLFLSFSRAQAGVANHISDTVREVAPGRDHFIYELLATNRLRYEVMFPAGANNYSHNQRVIPFRARIRQLVLCWQSSAVDNSEEGGQEAQATCHGVSYSSRKPRISRRAPSYSGTSPTTATTVLHALTSRSQHGIHIGISDRFCKYREMFFCTACIASLRLPEAPYPNSRSNPAARDAHLCLPGLPAATDDRQLVGIHTIKGSRAASRKHQRLH